MSSFDAKTLDSIKWWSSSGRRKKEVYGVMFDIHLGTRNVLPHSDSAANDSFDTKTLDSIKRWSIGGVRRKGCRGGV
jgi:hypothetical protein